MNATAPRIGFDRFIDIDWLRAAIDVRAGLASMEELSDVLDKAALGKAARKKTQTVLNRLWLEPRPNLADFANRGIAAFRDTPDIAAAALSWGMAITTYPFFAHVAELVGRLSALQGDFASAEVHRRMSEGYGEREGTYRMTNMVLQSQANWGAIKRRAGSRRFVRCKPKTIRNESAVLWLIEAALRYRGKQIPVSALQSIPILYPFYLDQPLAYVASKSPIIELRSESGSDRFVSLRFSE